MSARRNSTPDRRRDAWIPWLFAAFFGIVLTVNGILAYLAVSTFTGLETTDYYRKGLAYNEVLDAQREQAALGWDVAFAFEPDGAQRGLLAVRATDRAGRPLDGATVTATLVRPTQAGYDMEVTLAQVGAGSYEAELELPLRGQWDIRTRIEHRSGAFRTVQRIVTP